MTTNHTRVAVAPVSALLRMLPQHTSQVLEGTSLGLSWVDPASAGHNPDWTYSASAESGADGTQAIAGNEGEAAITGVVEDLDDDAGLIYIGFPGRSVIVDVHNLDIIGHGTDELLGPEDTDEVTIGVFLNNTLIAPADEGATAEMDVVTEFNVTGAYIPNLQVNDVVRVAFINAEGSEDTIAYKQLLTDPAVVTIR